MNKTQLIEEFKVVTGRLELTDAEVLVYLNRGFKTLDELDGSLYRKTRLIATLQAGEFYTRLSQEKRIIDSVWLHQGGERTQLAFTKPESIRTAIGGVATTGTPTFYALTDAMLVPSVPAEEVLIPANTQDVLNLGLGIQLQYIMVYPVPDAACHIEVSGSFYTPPLTEINTENRWTGQAPELCVQAAKYWMLKDLMEFSAADSIYNDLTLRVRQIEYDVYCEESINEMEA